MYMVHVACDVCTQLRLLPPQEQPESTVSSCTASGDSKALMRQVTIVIFLLSW